MSWRVATHLLALLTLAMIVIPGSPASAQDRKPPVDMSAKAPQVTPQPIVMEAKIPSAMGIQHVVFVLPPDYHDSDKRYPAVIAYAGKGETVRGNRAGAWGWVEKYGVVEAMAALHRGTPLTRDDFQGLITDDELSATNKTLEAQPYRGVILVCPFPPLTRVQRAKYERFVIDEVIPYAKAHLRVFDTPDRWGVDGISLGGLLSSSMGLSHPEHFKSIATQQGAVGSAHTLFTEARKNKSILISKKLNIVTSDNDPYKPANTKFATELGKMGLDVRLTVLRGFHNKAFVKGPGSMELLLFHDRVLWGSGEMPPERR